MTGQTGWSHHYMLWEEAFWADTSSAEDTGKLITGPEIRDLARRGSGGQWSQDLLLLTALTARRPAGRNTPHLLAEGYYCVQFW